MFTVSKNTSKGIVSYTLSSVSKAAKGKIKVSSAGKVTVAKGLKKGTYTVKVKVASKATTNYKSATSDVSFKVKVKA